MKKISKEEKSMWLEDWKQSGKKAWTYAKENALIPQTFVRWTKPGKEKVKQSFIEAPKQILQQTCIKGEILIEKGGMRIHIPLEPVLGELQTVITRLGQEL